MITDAQYALISPTPFVYLNQPGPIIIPDSTTVHANSNMRIAHTEGVRLFREVTGAEQVIVQKIVAMVEEVNLADICNRKNQINDTVSDVLNHPQDNYVQLMPHELLECEEIFKKTTYHPRDPIATVFYSVK